MDTGRLSRVHFMMCGKIAGWFYLHNLLCNSLYFVEEFFIIEKAKEGEA